MDKIARVRQEIERRSHGEQGFNSEDAEYGYRSCARDLLSFLDTLSEEPDKSLKETAEIIAKNILGRDYLAELDEDCAIDALEEAKNLVKAGAEWQKQQFEENYKEIFNDYWTRGFEEGRADMKEEMLKDAVEGFIFQSEDYYPKELIARYNGELKHGDKVRIVVLKAEE